MPHQIQCPVAALDLESKEFIRFLGPLYAVPMIDFMREREQQVPRRRKYVIYQSEQVNQHSQHVKHVYTINNDIRNL